MGKGGAGRDKAANGRVQVAYLHPHHVSHSWHRSFMSLLVYDLQNKQRIATTGGPFAIRCDTGALVDSRNFAVKKWLDETDHEWLFFIDTDMGFHPDTVDRLVEAADPEQRPVVGGLCFSLREIADDGYGGCRVTPVPTLFQMAREPDTGHFGFGTMWEFPPDTLVPVAATGAACLLIHRRAAEAVRAYYGDHWFDQVRYEDGRQISEDLSFCYRLGTVEQRVFVHTGVETTHHKQVWIGSKDYSPPFAATVAGVKVSPPPEEAQPESEAKLLSGYRRWTEQAWPVELAPAADPVASVREFGRWLYPMLKHADDLRRYRDIIEETKPQVIVETGTHGGYSALWFAQHPSVERVITIDVDPLIDRDWMSAQPGYDKLVSIMGDSIDPAQVETIQQLAMGKRVMVSLDSDHSRAHVAQEIALYGQLVSPGCHLVIEDGIIAWLDEDTLAQHACDYDGNVLEAIEYEREELEYLGFKRDLDTEGLTPVTMHPVGWWLRGE